MTIMAYNTPELLLVGVAQNLVLQTSVPLPGFKWNIADGCFGEDSTEYIEVPATW